MAELAKILVYGDIHLSSKNYGSHVNYPRETLDILRKITTKAEEIKATHIIGLGDFAYGRFHTLEYRAAVENELEKQLKITGGNRYELKGNHDSAGYGMTEFEYYISKGMLKPATNLTIGNCRITMADFGCLNKVEANISDGFTNILMAHEFITFKDLPIPNFGKSIEMDGFTKFFGTDFIVCGHIHSSGLYRGLMLGKSADGTSISHDVLLDYLGSMSRPAYYGEDTDKVGHILVLTVMDNGDVEYDRQDVEIPPLEEIFSLSEIQAKKEHAEAKAEEKRERLDMSDIVRSLDSHERAMLNPEDFIESLPNIDQRIKNKAIELLKLGGA